MITGLYMERDSPLHRLHPGIKLGALSLLGTALFFVSSLPWMLIALAGSIMLYGVARLPLKTLGIQLRPVLFIGAFIFLAQFWLLGWQPALLLVIRLCTLLLLASLVTLTTRTMDMVDTLEAALSPLRFIVEPARVGLAISLAIRFIPVIMVIAGEVRDAQKARGVERGLFAFAVPVIIRVLKMTDEIADAIDARS